MPTPVSRDVLNQETDARFWAQTGYKPGQKLDPNNPTDKAMEPVWWHFYNTVKAEADAGKLVTTYDHPEVVQKLTDAAVAHKAAAAYADTAVDAPNGQTQQQNIAAATTAQQISTQKTREAAAMQPPTVDPQIVKAAGQDAATVPPPPDASATDHIWHEHAHRHAHRHAQAVIDQATGAPPPSYPSPPSYPQPPRAPYPPSYPQMRPPIPPHPQMRSPYPPPHPQMRPPYPPMPPHPQRPPYPSHGRDHDHGQGRGHHRERGRGEYQTGPQAGPGGPGGMSAPSPEDVEGPPPPSPGGAPTGAPDTTAAPSDGAPSGSMETPPSDEGLSIGAYIAIGIAVIGGGGLLYYTSTRKPSKSLSPSRSRATRASRTVVSSSPSPFPSHERPARAPRSLPPALAPGAEV